MARTQLVHDGSGVIAGDDKGDTMLAFGTAIPTDGASGYAKNCLFIDTNATDLDLILFVNLGTPASCNFDAGHLKTA